MKSAVQIRALALTSLFALTAPALGRSPQEHGDDAIQIAGSEVLLDLVVLDKKGRPVLDLRADEIEVFEDGKRQEIASFAAVGSGPTAAGNRTAAGPPAGSPELPRALADSPLLGQNLILIVVDRTTLQKQNLDATFRAAERFINERLAPHDRVAVFAAGRSLAVLQNFTNDKARLLEAMRRATGSVDPEAARAQMDADVHASSLPGPTAPEVADRAGAGPVDVLDVLPQTLDQAVTELRSQVQARSTIYNLLALTKVYSKLPGRKSVVLYSEGFPVDDANQAALDAMIGLANRNNFAFYTADAAGLRADVDLSRVQGPRPRRPIEESNNRMLVRGGESGIDRIVRDALRGTESNKVLLDIASQTGGVSLRNRNDLSGAFDAMENDLRAYYVLSYAPTNAALDGTYRAISVKVLRQGVDVRTRRGYFAAPGGNATPVLPYERPVLALLSGPAGTTRSNDLRAAVSTAFFRRGDAWVVPVSVKVDAAALAPAGQPGRSQKDGATGAVPGHALFDVSAVALVKDSKGNVVARLGRSVQLRVAAEQLATLQGQEVTIESFPQPLVLEPGAYSIELGVYDPNSKKASVLTKPLRLPPLPRAGAAGLSGIVLSRVIVKADDLGRTVPPNDPLLLGGAYVIPSVTASFSKARNEAVSVFFRFYGTSGRQYQARIQIVRDGKPVTATAPMAMPEVGPAGEVGFAPTFPIASLQPGSYRLFVHVAEVGAPAPVASGTQVFTVE